MMTTLAEISNMTKKTQPGKTENTETPKPPSAKDSAQQIWLAGLAAFTKAQQEGGKVFEALVNEGLGIQRKTQAAAEEKLSEATSKVAHLATDATAKAGYQWGKLENIFEDRVAKALSQLGIPGPREFEALSTRIDALEKALEKALQTDSTPPTAAKKRPPAAKKAAAKTTPKSPAKKER